MDRGAEGGRRTGSRFAAALAGCTLLLSLGACTFERRADPGEASAPALTTEDSVRGVVASLDAARRDGDMAAALNLFDADAQVSPLAPSGSESPEEPWRTPAEALAGGWSPETAIPSLELLESRVEFPGTGTALVLNRYANVAPGPGEPPAAETTTPGSMVIETMVLIRREGEWRIRHLHRSFPLRPGTRP